MLDPTKATRIQLLDFRTPPMRAFHMSWFALFVCFFAWFGITPLMHIVRQEMDLTHDQLGWCIIGSVTVTVLARVLVGWMCDRIGPRLTYTWLLLLGSIPVMCIGLADRYETFLLARVAIGVIGASFVITQYHTSAMFAANCVGTANATTAGWGNMGGGAAQVVMPLVFALFVGVLGFSESMGWRLSMLVAGAVCVVTGIAYFLLTQDTPEGNVSTLRAAGRMPAGRPAGGSFVAACKDKRVWALFVVYGACFGVELTINNIAALYFLDYFPTFQQQMDSSRAVWMVGLLAGSFGLMNLFARTLGGVFGDKLGQRWGLSGRVKWLFVVVFCEGLALMLFSRMNVLILAVPSLVLFSLFVQMSEGATFSVVPFVNRKAPGAVSGIVGAGGNVGAVMAGFLFKSQAVSWPNSLFLIGAAVTCVSFVSFAVVFSPGEEAAASAAMADAIGSEHRPVGDVAPV
jgi:NNP family nitrate/nitrite transporter-like MFS transporter